MSLPASVETWSEDNVVTWIASLSNGTFAGYQDFFKQNNITGKRLVNLNDDKLGKLGISSLGHREDILEAIEELKRKPTNRPPTTTTTTTVTPAAAAAAAAPPPAAATKATSLDDLNNEVVRLVKEVKNQDSALVIEATSRVVKTVKDLVPSIPPFLMTHISDFVTRAKTVSSGNNSSIAVQQLVESAKHLIQSTADAMTGSTPSTLSSSARSEPAPAPAAPAAPKVTKSPTMDALILTTLKLLNLLVQTTKKNASSKDVIIDMASKVATTCKKLLDDVDSNGTQVSVALNMSTRIASALTTVLQATKGITAANTASGGIDDFSSQLIVNSGIALSRTIKEFAASYAAVLGPTDYPCGKCGRKIDDDTILCSGPSACDRWFHRRCVALIPGSFECFEWLCDIPPCSAKNQQREREELAREEEKQRIMLERKREEEERNEKRRLEEEKRLAKKQQEEEERRQREEEKRQREEEKRKHQAELRKRELELLEEEARRLEDPFVKRKFLDDPAALGPRSGSIGSRPSTPSAPSTPSTPLTHDIKPLKPAIPDMDAKTLIAKASALAASPPAPGFEDKKLLCIARAVFDYDIVGGSDSDLLFVKNDLIRIYSKSSDWWEGELEGKSGNFPASFVEEVKINLPPTGSGSGSGSGSGNISTPTLPSATANSSAAARPFSSSSSPSSPVTKAPPPASPAASATAPTTPTTPTTPTAPTATKSIPHSTSSPALRSVALPDLDDAGTPQLKFSTVGPAKGKKAREQEKKENTVKLKLTKNMISLPKQDSFEHIAHVGWNSEEQAFESDNVPDQWKAAISDPASVLKNGKNISAPKKAPPAPPSARPPAPPVAPASRPQTAPSNTPSSASPSGSTSTSTPATPDSEYDVVVPKSSAPSKPAQSTVLAPSVNDDYDEVQPLPSTTKTMPTYAKPVKPSKKEMEDYNSDVLAKPPPPPENEYANVGVKQHDTPQLGRRKSSGIKEPKIAVGGDGTATVSVALTRTDSNTKIYKAKFSYAAKRDDELEMKAGDKIRLLKENDDGWGIGINMRTGLRGAVPLNYIVVDE